jgi:hypothetical protein
MQRKKKPNRSRKVTIRLSQEEYDLLSSKCKDTTSRQLSEYLRDILNKGPVTVRHRNQSADDFLPIAIQLKNELNSIGKNFNQVIRLLHQMDPKMILKSQLENIEACQFSLMQKVDELKLTMQKIYTLWSQE